jgi:transcriptional regulator with XRE-family HTH domain
MSFGKAIRDYRKLGGMNQRDLAEKAGIDFTYLSKIENNRTPPPSEDVIRAMSEALGVNADELLRLAGKVPSDLAEFLVTDTQAMPFLRSFERDVRTRQDWIDFLRKRDEGAS